VFSRFLILVDADVQDVLRLAPGFLYFLEGTVLFQLEHPDAVVQLRYIVIY
jgi:hypothetical protein